MPTVPSASGFADVAPAALPGVRVSPDAPYTAFPGSVPRGVDLSGVSQEVDDMNRQAVARANQVRVLDAVAQAGQLKSQTIDQIQQLRGKDAFGAPDTARDAWQKGIGAITQGLSANQQAMFQPHAVSEQLDLDASVQRHVAQQEQQVDEDTFHANDQNLQNDAIRHAADGDFGAVAADVENRATNARLYAQRNGLPQDAADATVATSVSQSHAAVIEQLLAAGQDLSAKAYLTKYANELVGADRINATKAVDVGSSRGASQQQADRITTTTSSLSDAMSQVRQITDPTVRDETEARVKQFYAEQGESARMQHEQDMVGAGNTIDQTGAVTAIAPQTWASFTPGEKTQLNDYALHKAKGEPIQTDWQRYYDLRQIAGASPATFIKMSLWDDRANLGDSEFKELSNLQSEMRKGQGQATLDGYQSRDAIVNGALSSIGIDPTLSPKNKSVDQAVTFRRMVDDRVRYLETETGKKATSTDVQHITDNLLIKGTVPGSGVFSPRTESVFEAAMKGDRLVLSAKDIPAEERLQITQALQARGIPVTDQAMIRLYSDKISRGLP